MIDKNGTYIKAGDIVRITGAFFKVDNGLYFVEQDGSNPGYLADDRQVTLKRICKNGKISTGKNTVCFFPLKSYTNNRMKNAEALKWNREHAEIEIVRDIDDSYVIEWLEKEARNYREQEEYYNMRGYAPEHWGNKYAATAEYFEAAAARMKAEPAPVMTIDEFIKRYAPAN